MLSTLWAIVRDKKIELLENVDIREGTKVLVTLLTNKDELEFWQNTGQISLDKIWNNTEDDVYAQLL